jgi:hypothetical protein
MLQNRAVYATYLDLHGVDFDAYIQGMRDTHTWGTYVEVDALAHMSGRPIEVFSDCNNNVDLAGIDVSKYPSNSLFIVNYMNTHFEPCVPAELRRFPSYISFLPRHSEHFLFRIPFTPYEGAEDFDEDEEGKVYEKKEFSSPSLASASNSSVVGEVAAASPGAGVGVQSPSSAPGVDGLSLSLTGGSEIQSPSSAGVANKASAQAFMPVSTSAFSAPSRKRKLQDGSAPASLPTQQPGGRAQRTRNPTEKGRELLRSGFYSNPPPPKKRRLNEKEKEEKEEKEDDKEKGSEGKEDEEEEEGEVDGEEDDG